VRRGPELALQLAAYSADGTGAHIGFFRQRMRNGEQKRIAHVDVERTGG
jgi:hypothetical protein